eukprot:scaffold64138_cov30-Tisochrysis_lutea.AAC.2
MCLRLEALPVGAPLPLFNGGAVPSKGERIDHVYVYKNGGVGAMGDMGAAEAAVSSKFVELAASSLSWRTPSHWG